MKTYYEILGLLCAVDDVVVKAAYKALAQKYHPDKQLLAPDEAHQFMTELNSAYSVLSDSEKRKRYEEYLKKGAEKIPQPNNQPQKTVDEKAKELIDRLIKNSLDEIAVLQLFEKYFGCSVRINAGWINSYTVVMNGKPQKLDYLSLKNHLIDHLNQGVA